METTIVLILLAAFAVTMILMHKFGGLCTAPAAPASSMETSCETPRAKGDCHTPMTPEDLPRAKASNSLSDCGSPSSDYAISITDSTAEDLLDAPVATRSTRVISFLRFSGYSQSDISLADRSTSYSLWSSFCYSKGSECGEAVKIDEVETPPKKFTSKPRQRYDVNEEVDCVEIGELDGFARRNLLSFKPQKPRALTTKHIKKKTQDAQHLPTHAYSL